MSTSLTVLKNGDRLLHLKVANNDLFCYETQYLIDDKVQVGSGSANRAMLIAIAAGKDMRGMRFPAPGAKWTSGLISSAKAYQ
jgi:hypothetical protein